MPVLKMLRLSSEQPRDLDKREEGRGEDTEGLTLVPLTPTSHERAEACCVLLPQGKDPSSPGGKRGKLGPHEDVSSQAGPDRRPA